MAEEPRDTSTISFRHCLIRVWQCACFGVGRDTTPFKSVHVDFEKDLRVGRYQKKPRTEQPIPFAATQKTSVTETTESRLFTNTTITPGVTTSRPPLVPPSITSTPLIPNPSLSSIIDWEGMKSSARALWTGSMIPITAEAKQSIPLLSIISVTSPVGTTTFSTAKTTPFTPTTSLDSNPTTTFYGTTLKTGVEKVSTDQLTPPGRTPSSEKKQPISLSSADSVSQIESLAPPTAQITSQLINQAPPPPLSDFTLMTVQISHTSGILTTVINKERITVELVASGKSDIVNGVTFGPGSASTIGDILISKEPSGILVLYPSSPAQASVGAVIASVLGINDGGLSSAVIIEGKVLTPGGTIIASGTTYILPSGKPLAEISGKTYTIPTAAANAAPASIGAFPSPGVIIGGNILTSGGTIVVSGTTYLLPTGGTVPLIETSLPSLTIPISKPSQGSGVILDGKTLLPGGTLVVSGTTYILPTGGTSPVALATASNIFPTVPSPPTQGSIEANGSSGRQANNLFVGLTTIISAISTFLFSF